MSIKLLFVKSLTARALLSLPAVNALELATPTHHFARCVSSLTFSLHLSKMAPPTAVDIEAVTDTQAIVLPDPLTVNSVSARRAKAGPLNGGTAAFTSSDFFKHQSQSKPKAKRWDRKSVFQPPSSPIPIDYLQTTSPSKPKAAIHPALRVPPCTSIIPV